MDQDEAEGIWTIFYEMATNDNEEQETQAPIQKQMGVLEPLHVRAG